MQSQYFDIYCNAIYVKTASEAYFQIKGDLKNKTLIQFLEKYY